MKLTIEELEKKLDHDNHLLDLSANLFSQRKLTKNDIQLMCRYLKNHTEITSLNIDKNIIGDEVVKAIAANSTIKKLEFRWSEAGVLGASALATNSTLISLSFSNNKLRDEGAKALAAN